jgi:hypothetical protein
MNVQAEIIKIELIDTTHTTKKYLVDVFLYFDLKGETVTPNTSTEFTFNLNQMPRVYDLAKIEKFNFEQLLLIASENKETNLDFINPSLFDYQIKEGKIIEKGNPFG